MAKKIRQKKSVPRAAGASPDSVGRQGISACLIVKDEAETLPRCLDSLKGRVDEIVVVDTGSGDKTVEIAKTRGARVYHHPWEEDFSKHRNQSIGYATQDWILVIDADEVVREWDPDLERKICDQDIDSLQVRVENPYGRGEGLAWHNSVRLFRNNGRIRYQGRVHNELKGHERWAHSAIRIYHRGYALSGEREAQRYTRTQRLLEKALEDEPENPKWHHYLAVSYLGKGLHGKAFQEAQRALNCLHKGGEEPLLYLWTRFVGAVSALNMNRLREAEDLALEAIQIHPMHMDSHYLLSSLYYAQGKAAPFLAHSERYLELLRQFKQAPEAFGPMVHNTVGHEWRIRLHRAFTFTKQGEEARARKEYARALASCHNRGEYYRERCMFHLRAGAYRDAERLLRKAKKLLPGDKVLFRAEKELQKGMQAHTEEGRGRGPLAVSLCMIVKNEENFLPRCLESLKDCVEEMIIVDTGSTDRTVEIARSYGAKVYSHPWEGHFSKHRNQAIGYATKDWILVLDADEYLLPGCKDALREAIRDETIDSVYVSVKNPFDRGRGEAVHNSIRIFRNNGVIHYEGRVHNRLVGEEASKVYPITILHEGYNLPAHLSRQKFLRTTHLLEQEIAENPHHPRAYHYLAASYLSENMYEQALDAARRAVDLAEKNGYTDFIYLWSRFIAGLCYLKTGRVEEAEQVCLGALEKFPMHLDSHYLLCIIYFEKGEMEGVLSHGARYLEVLERIGRRPGEFGPMVHNTVNHAWRVHLHRGFAWAECGEGKKAREAFSQAHALCEQRAEYHRLMAIFHMRRAEGTEAQRHLEEALRHNPEDVAFYREGAEIYKSLGKREEEMACLKEVLRRDSHDTYANFRLGTILLEEGRYTDARGHLLEVISRDPTHSSALINLGVLAKRTGELDEALRYFESALGEEPDAVEALSNLGYLHYQEGRFPQAREVFEHLSRVAPELLDIHLMLCMVYLQLGSLEPVVGRCDRIMALLGLGCDITLHCVSDLARLFVQIGGVLLEKDQFPLANVAFRLALQLGEETNLTLKVIGKVCLERGAYGAGIQYLEKAIRMNSQDGESFSLMGACYEKMGVREAASMCRQKAKELNGLPPPFSPLH